MKNNKDLKNRLNKKEMNLKKLFKLKNYKNREKLRQLLKNNNKKIIMQMRSENKQLKKKKKRDKMKEINQKKVKKLEIPRLNKNNFQRILNNKKLIN